ncbi:MAG: tetratricopeptide (TPR) repeat protein [Paraglaciecola sp.]|jgi:tetratricopeptide (TPR) repeat protein
MRTLALFPLIILLSACNEPFPLKVQDICKEQPQFCSDLNPDSWCLVEKKQIIRHRYAYLKAPAELIDYRLLLDFEDYKTCISRASQIVHIKDVEKQAKRMQAVVVAEKELKRLTAKTQNATQPHLLLYHWSRFGKQGSLQKFLSLRDTDKLNSYELQIGLASYYAKFDLERAISTLHRALELYTEQDELDNEIFASLSTLYLTLNDFKNAYVWGKVAEEFSEKDINLALIRPLLSASNKIKILDEIAQDYVDAIEDREFQTPL